MTTFAIPCVRRLSIAVAAGLFAAGCGGGGGAPTPAGSASTSTTSSTSTTATTETTTLPASATTTAGGVAYIVQASLSGSDSVQGSFTSHNAGACGAPEHLTGIIGAHSISVLTPVGQGATAGQAVSLTPGDVTVQVDSDTWVVGSSSNAPQGSSGQFEYMSNGSGTLTFQNLALSSNPARQPQESGSFQWTCH